MAQVLIGACISVWPSGAERMTKRAPISPVAWLPVAIFVFGIGDVPAIFLVFITVFFAIVLSTVAQFESVPKNYLHVARIMGATEAQTLEGSATGTTQFLARDDVVVNDQIASARMAPGELAAYQAVADGVDVLNYSISGTTTNVVDPVEVAFMHAAAAGVFVAASSGNSGPTVSTTAHPSPWITTVAASTTV